MPRPSRFSAATTAPAPTSSTGWRPQLITRTRHPCAPQHRASRPWRRLVTAAVWWQLGLALTILIALRPSLRSLRYKPATSGQEEILSRSVLLHVTTAAHGEEIDQGDGTVWLRPRSGIRGALLELFHQNWSVLRGDGSVYVWGSLPEDHEFVYHVNPAEAEVVVKIPGSELLAQAGHRGVWCSPHDGAVAIRGGYRGPGEVVDINTVMTPPAPLSRWQWVVFGARAFVRTRPHL